MMFPKTTNGLEQEPDRAPMSDAATELLLRHGLGEFGPRVRERLDQIVRDAFPDALERLNRAAAYLGVDGAHVYEVSDRWPEPENDDYER
jgi:hypothetical protein